MQDPLRGRRQPFLPLVAFLWIAACSDGGEWQNARAPSGAFPQGAIRTSSSGTVVSTTGDADVNPVGGPDGTGGNTDGTGSTNPGSPGDPSTSVPEVLHFNPVVNSVGLLPFQVRLQKVNYVTQAAPGLTTGLLGNRNLLGDHDYSKGIQAQSAWTDSQMKLWLEGLLPVCESQALRTRFTWPDKAEEFLVSALGRPVNAGDRALITKINALTVTPVEKFTLGCLVVLSSLEFNTK